MIKHAIRHLGGLFFYGAALWAHALEVEPFCYMTENRVGVSLEGSLSYKSGINIPQYIYIDCSQDGCEGFIAGTNWVSTRTIPDLRLEYKSPNLAVLKAGFLREFQLDRSTGSFTWIEGLSETGGRFQAKCPPNW